MKVGEIQANEQSSRQNPIGRIQTVAWYRFEGDPHVYTFHTAIRNDGEVTVLRSNESTFPGVVAARNNVTYSFMRNATGEEVQEFLDSHPELVVVEVKEI
jgi:hypothetical protein